MSLDTTKRQMEAEQVAEVFDIEKALAATDSDKDLMEELIDMFLEQSDQSLERIQQAIRDESADQLRYAAHTLKGAGSSVGAMTVSESAAALEEMGRDNNLDAACTVFEELKIEMRAFRNLQEKRKERKFHERIHS